MRMNTVVQDKYWIYLPFGKESELFVLTIINHYYKQPSNAPST